MTSLKKNTLWSIGEFASVVFVQFFVMRYIVVVLGVGSLGIWSVLMSAVQLASFFDLGTSAGTGRFLSKAHLDGDIDRIEKILATITFITIPLYVVLSAVLYVPLNHGLAFVLQESVLEKGRDLLVFAICSYVGQVVSAAFSSSLTGLHLGFRKSQIAITGIIIQATLSVLLIRKYGLPGLAVAQITNYVFSICASLFILKTSVGIRLWGILRWDWQIIRSVMKFGVGIQVSSLAWGGFEAAIRFVMSKFGGIEQVGYYEIAYKVASQPRVLAFYMGQSLSPALVALGATDKDKFLVFYRQIYARLSLFAGCSAVGIILFSPVVGLIMLGRVEPSFLLFSVLTACGTMAHISAIPSELTAIACGILRYNIAGTLTALVTMLLVGPLSGYFFHAPGVAVAVLFSSLLAASIPIFFNNRAFNLPYLPAFSTDLNLAELLKGLYWQRGARDAG